MIDAVIGTRSGREHGPTLASSVVAEEVAGRGERLVLNTAPRWQAAWWPKRSRGGASVWF